MPRPRGIRPAIRDSSGRLHSRLSMFSLTARAADDDDIHDQQDRQDHAQAAAEISRTSPYPVRRCLVASLGSCKIFFRLCVLTIVYESNTLIKVCQCRTAFAIGADQSTHSKMLLDLSVIYHKASNQAAVFLATKLDFLGTAP